MVLFLSVGRVVVLKCICCTKSTYTEEHCLYNEYSSIKKRKKRRMSDRGEQDQKRLPWSLRKAEAIDQGPPVTSRELFRFRGNSLLYFNIQIN